MLGNADETEFDLRFQLFGIPVRVHPLFWLMAAFIAWYPNRLDLVLIGVLCVFVSIMIHELGHAVMFRHFGFRGEIVLYMLGGFAYLERYLIPSDSRPLLRDIVREIFTSSSIKHMNRIPALNRDVDEDEFVYCLHPRTPLPEVEFVTGALKFPLTHSVLVGFVQSYLVRVTPTVWSML